MGLGGHLLWTSVIRTLSEQSGRPVRVCHRPMVSDLLGGRLYRSDVSLVDDPVFRHNPRVEFPPVAEKPRWIRGIDRIGQAVIRRAGLGNAYERLVFGLSRRRARRTGQHDAHLDLRIHSYVERERPDRMTWKSGGHIIDIILANYGRPAADHQCEMYFSAAEQEEAADVRRQYGIGADYVVIEPNSNETWFSDLRAWPFERWQQIVDDIATAERYQVVQIGEAGRPGLRGVIDLSGKIPFRIAALLMKSARLFLGLEGGLMHVANAVRAPAVIVWGGITVPEFAGYREMHSIVCNYVECAPCGLRGGCPYGKKCLTQIDVGAVLLIVHQQLAGIDGSRAVVM